MTLLLTTVLANPHDPMRGALSDHWAEYGVPPVVLPCGQAIEPTDPRVAYQPGDAVPWGFRCTMAEWCGGGRCPRDMDRDGTCYYMCNVCRGTGRIPGIAAAVCGAWPITVVELTDREPLNETIRFAWYSRVRSDYRNTIESPLWDLLAGFIKYGDGNPYLLKWYPTRDFAIAALSHAALTLGRRAAGLPDIQFINHK